MLDLEETRKVAAMLKSPHWPTWNEPVITCGEIGAMLEEAAAELETARAILADALAEVEHARMWFRAIRDHDGEQYEVCIDDFAYRRLVSAYREAAEKGLAGPRAALDAHRAEEVS